MSHKTAVEVLAGAGISFGLWGTLLNSLMVGRIQLLEELAQLSKWREDEMPLWEESRG